MRRVLRPGGRLVLGTIVARLLPGNWFAMRFATEAAHRRGLAAGGFVVERIQRVGFNIAVITARAALPEGGVAG